MSLASGWPFTPEAAEEDAAIFAEAIPRKPTGKILKRVLRDQYSVLVPM